MSIEERDRIESAFMERMKSQHIKHTSIKYYQAQAEFFVGVCVGLNIEPPPYWSICIMSGRDIVEEKRKKNG